VTKKELKIFDVLARVGAGLVRLGMSRAEVPLRTRTGCHRAG
jgi:hypothetical protein